MIKFLFWFIFVYDLISPLLFSYNLMDKRFRGLSTIIIIYIFLYSFFFKTKLNIYIKNILFIIIIFCFFYLIISLINASTLLNIFWGILIFLKYPMLGLVVYNEPIIIGELKDKLNKIFFYLLTLILMLQFYQYFSLNEEWDNVGGIFGNFGTARLLTLIMLIICFFVGTLIFISSRRNLFNFIFVQLICLVISILGEIKFYFFLMFLVFSFSVLLFFLKEKRYNKKTLVILGMTISALIFSFPKFYDNLYGIRTGFYFEDFFKIDKIEDYLNQYTQIKNSQYDIGRSLAISLSFEQLNDNVFNLLFGYGFGSKSQSDFLNSAGIAVVKSGYLDFTGSSLVVFLTEFGIIGIIIIFSSIFLIIKYLYRYKSIHKDNFLSKIIYTLIIFSMLWPALLYYSNVWIHPISMQFYWGFLGYSIRNIHNFLLANKQILNFNKFNYL